MALLDHLCRHVVAQHIQPDFIDPDGFRLHVLIFAQVVKKGKRRLTEPDGKATHKMVQHLGYKSHVSMNAETGLITSIVPSGCRAADDRQFGKLLAHDEEVGAGVGIYAGDKACYEDISLCLLPLS